MKINKRSHDRHILCDITQLIFNICAKIGFINFYWLIIMVRSISFILLLLLSHFFDHIELVVMLRSFLFKLFSAFKLVLLVFIDHILRIIRFLELFGQLRIQFRYIQSFMTIFLTILLGSFQIGIQGNLLFTLFPVLLLLITLNVQNSTSELFW
jgi:hypothetical protein